MANCNKLFYNFDGAISVSGARRKELIRSKNALRKVVRQYCTEVGLPVPRFMDQGSLKTGALIQKRDGTYDADTGVYFLMRPDLTPANVHSHVLRAVDDHTEAGAEHRQRCIRVIYAGDHHVDLPVYFKEEHDPHPFLVTKDGELLPSDPKAFWEWFNDKANDQLRRLIKYLKAWTEQCPFKTPSGVALTVWAASNYVADERDDIAMEKLLNRLVVVTALSCDCNMPTVPRDNLTRKLDDSQKAKFREALVDFAEDASAAVSEKNQLKASMLWRGHLGDRFPYGADEDIDAKEKLLRETAARVLSGTAFTSRAGVIYDGPGVQHLPHRNYGA
jgi:hypothetical protein